jgi:hypothetical protein
VAISQVYGSALQGRCNDRPEPTTTPLAGHRHRWECSSVADSFRKYDVGDPKNDPRSVDELIAVTLSEQDEDLYWDVVWALQWRGSHEVLDRAAELCRSVCAVERGTGANMMAQLHMPDRTFPGHRLQILLEMLKNEQNHSVLRSILIALSHLHLSEVIEPALRFRGHECVFGVLALESEPVDPRL